MPNGYRMTLSGASLDKFVAMHRYPELTADFGATGHQMTPAPDYLRRP
jgi:hypothetical protein